MTFRVGRCQLSAAKDGPSIGFQRVGEEKGGKNQLHLDLTATAESRKLSYESSGSAASQLISTKAGGSMSSVTPTAVHAG
jgi:hypothetical protein